MGIIAWIALGLRAGLSGSGRTRRGGLGAPVNGPVQPAGGRRMMSTGAAIVLLAVGGILRFAVAPGSPLGPR